MCPNRTVQPNFEVDDYMGHWVELKTYPTTPCQDISCTRANYTKQEDGDFAFTHYGLLSNGTEVIAQAKAIMVTPGSFSISYHGEPDPQHPNYHVLNTDYTNYAIVWNCKQMEDTFEELFLILGRNKDIPESMYAPAIKQWGKDPKDFQTTDQGDKCNHIM